MIAGYWQERVDHAVDQWHAARGTRDPSRIEPPPLTLRDRYDAFRLHRAARQLGIDIECVRRVS